MELAQPCKRTAGVSSSSSSRLLQGVEPRLCLQGLRRRRGASRRPRSTRATTRGVSMWPQHLEKFKQALQIWIGFLDLLPACCSQANTFSRVCVDAHRSLHRMLMCVQHLLLQLRPCACSSSTCWPSYAEHGVPQQLLCAAVCTRCSKICDSAGIPQAPLAPASPRQQQQQQHSGWKLPSQPEVKEPQSPGRGLVGGESTSEMLLHPSPGAPCLFEAGLRPYPLITSDNTPCRVQHRPHKPIHATPCMCLGPARMLGCCCAEHKH